MSQDPVGDGVNWYAYVGSNPVVGVDPEGLWDPDTHRLWATTAARRAGFTVDDAMRIGDAAHDIDNVWTLGREPHYGDRSGYAGQMAYEGIELWNAGKRNEALKRWGQGAHALEDVYAHRDIGKLEHVLATVANFFTGQHNIEDPARLRALAGQSKKDTACYFGWIQSQLQ